MTILWTITEVQNYKSEGEMLHGQNDKGFAIPTAPYLVPRIWIYVQALVRILRRIDRTECQERDALRQNHRDHRGQKLDAVAPQHKQHDLHLRNKYILYINSRLTTSVQKSESLPP